MKKWILKAIVQKTISYLPFSHNINYVFQKYVTKGVNLSDDYFYDRLGHAREHLDYYKKYSGKPAPETSLEIGTGWYPIVPITFFLAGSSKIYSVDISFLTSKERLATTIHKIIECNDRNLLKDYVSILPERWAVLTGIIEQLDSLTLEEMLSRLNITYLIEDARKLSLADSSIDLVNSNNTFEHIYPEILIPILKDFKRVVKKNGGIMSHFIDMSDHFAHFDKSINVYNFLQFTDTQWQWIDNSIQPQSRIRIYDYKKIYADLQIPIDFETTRKGNQGELKTIALAPAYTGKPAAETAITHCHFVSCM
ncbi:MAG TPA: class I SAM-dependent methyltransferase [Chitinophagales bacterium]|nr:class I SAM-dependent methyltransferase [Chitinophagales bacterium]